MRRLRRIGPGDPGKADAIDEAMIEKAKADGVVFTGERTDLPECYAAMDIFVMASWREGFPRSAMEAAAMGLPTIATNIRGCRQVVQDGVTGVLVPARDVESLVVAVSKVCAVDQFDRNRIGTRARIRFDQRALIGTTITDYCRLQRR